MSFPAIVFCFNNLGALIRNIFGVAMKNPYHFAAIVTQNVLDVVLASPSKGEVFIPLTFCRKYLSSIKTMDIIEEV